MKNMTSLSAKELRAIAEAGDAATREAVAKEFERRAAKREDRAQSEQDEGKTGEMHMKHAERARLNAAEIRAIGAPVAQAAMVTKPSASLSKLKKADLIELVEAMLAKA